MTTLTSVEIGNFMAIGSTKLALDDRGLILIKGENNEDSSAKSNGAGKSSIGDAISWCLFGETARGESGDAIVNETAGKNTRVIVRVDDDTGFTTIARHRKHTGEKNRLVVTRCPNGSPDIDMTGGTDKITQDTVHQIIGCTAEVFNAAIYAGQEKMPNLPAMTDKELKLIVEQAAGIEEMQLCHDRARQHAAKAKTGADTMTARLNTLDQSIAEMESSIERGRKATDSFEFDRTDAIVKLTNERAAIDITSNERSQKDLMVQVSDLKFARKDLLDLIGSTDSEELKEAKAKYAALSKPTSALESEVKRLGREIKGLQEKGTGTDALVGTNCGECGKTYAECDLTTAREAITARLRFLAGEYRAATAKRTENSEALLAAEKQVTKLQAEFDAATVKARARINQIDTEMSEISVSLATLQTLFQAATKLDEQIEINKKAPNPYAALVEEDKERLQLKQDSRDAIAASLITQMEEVALREAAVEVFSPAGVRAHILDHVTPFLNAKTAAYLNTLSDGNITATWATLTKTAKGELREKFCIEVTSKTGGSRFGLLSGGEKRKVRLACALAMQDLVASRATKPLRLFVADEIDDALDPAGLERLMTVLDEKARERGTVLVISHNNLDDWIRESITVKKKGGVSTVEGSICLP